jgi:hypothetical protein
LSRVEPKPVPWVGKRADHRDVHADPRPGVPTPGRCEARFAPTRVGVRSITTSIALLLNHMRNLYLGATRADGRNT